VWIAPLAHLRSRGSITALAIIISMKEKSKTIRISIKAYRKLKMRSAREGKTMLRLISELARV